MTTPRLRSILMAVASPVWVLVVAGLPYAVLALLSVNNGSRSGFAYFLGFIGTLLLFIAPVLVCAAIVGEGMYRSVNAMTQRISSEPLRYFAAACVGFLLYMVVAWVAIGWQRTMIMANRGSGSNVFDYFVWIYPIMNGLFGGWMGIEVLENDFQTRRFFVEFLILSLIASVLWSATLAIFQALFQTF